MKKILIIVVLIVIGIIIFWNLPRASTADGINPNPIYAITWEMDFKVLDTLPRNIAATSSIEGWSRIVIYPLNDTNEDTDRYIEIYKFLSNENAIKEYESYKKELLEWDYNNLYEDESGNNKYFISYKTVRFHTDHGIPIRIDTSPDLSLWFLKNNVFIMITYEWYRNYGNYIYDINSDIMYVSDILKGTITSKK